MTTFHVQDMSCGHCVKAITEALHCVDTAAAVRIDLATHEVEIASTGASPAALAQAISEAGYTPVEMKDSAPVAPATKACCSGCSCH
jgi:copper chaperone